MLDQDLCAVYVHCCTLLSESVLPMGPVDFEVFTSIRSDVVLKDSRLNTSLSGTGEPSQFYMLRYHRDRLLSAAKQFNFTEAIRFLSDSASAHILELKLREYLLHKFGSYSYTEPLKVPGKHLPSHRRSQVEPRSLKP